MDSLLSGMVHFRAGGLGRKIARLFMAQRAPSPPPISNIHPSSIYNFCPLIGTISERTVQYVN